MDKVIENLLESDKALQKANHLLCVTFPLIKSKNLLIKIVLEIRNSVMKSIAAILYYEYIMKRVCLTKNPEENFEFFEKKCGPVYKISPEEIRLIKELFETTKKHEESVMEIMAKERIMILSKDMEKDMITSEKAKEFLETAKNIFRKTKEFIITERRNKKQ